MLSEHLEPLEVWEGRCHGIWRASGVFLIYTRDGTEIIRMEPEAYGSDPLQVYASLLEYDRSIHQPTAGGYYKISEFNFTLLPPDRNRIPEFFVRVFSSAQVGPSHWFNQYRGAQILIRSAQSGFGTIEDVLQAAARPLTSG